MTDGRSLDDRVTELEEKVHRLESAMGQPRPSPFAPGPATPAPAQPQHVAPRQGTPGIPEKLTDVRYWFRILGIGLLLLGTIFLFKYSKDEGRGIMTLRVTIGAAMGLGLVAIGYRLRHSERHFSSILSGGGIGVWYITGFAAFQIFDLIPALPAFAFMTVVTVLAFMLAVRQNVAALSVIGALGGMGTPWLLYETDRALAGPVAYMCLVLAGAAVTYVRKRWKALLWTSAVAAGGAFTAIGSQYYVGVLATDQKVALQAGVAFYWIVLAVVAVFRERQSQLNKELVAAATPAATATDAQGAKVLPRDTGDIPVFVTVVPIYAAIMTTAIWEPNTSVGGWVAFLAAVPYAVVWRRLEVSRELTSLARAHLLAALVLVTMGIALLLDGDIMIAAIAAEGAALHVLARRTPGRLMAVWAHLIYFMSGIVVLGRVVAEDRAGLPMINGPGLTNLWVIVSGAVASLVMRTPRERFVYRYVAHGLILLWVLRELHELPNGQGVVTIVWGFYALVLIVMGLRGGSTKLRVVGLITLFLTVSKLIIVDLSEVKAIWRVLLFSGFGILLLGLSHWVQRFVKKTS